MKKVIKKEVYTVGGILLSFAIIIGGWAFTKKMIDKKEIGLFSKIELIEAADDSPKEKSNPLSEEDFDLFLVHPLNHEEIYEILTNWENIEYQRPHEPMEGQIGMEQAIETGKEFLYDFALESILPESDSAHEFTKINAFLCRNHIGSANLRLSEQYYSYWTVLFENERLHAELIINAVTKQVWKAEITCINENMDNKGLDKTYLKDVEVMEVFEAHLGFEKKDVNHDHAFLYTDEESNSEVSSLHRAIVNDFIYMNLEQYVSERETVIILFISTKDILNYDN